MPAAPDAISDEISAIYDANELQLEDDPYIGELELISIASPPEPSITGQTTVYFDEDPNHPVNTDRHLNRNIMRNLGVIPQGQDPITWRGPPPIKFDAFYTRSVARDRLVTEIGCCTVCMQRIDIQEVGGVPTYRPDLVRYLRCGHFLHRDCILAHARYSSAPIKCDLCKASYSLTEFLDFARPF